MEKVLVVGSILSAENTLAIQLEASGFEVVSQLDGLGDAALTGLYAAVVDMDYQLPRVVAIVQVLRRLAPHVTVVALTMAPDVFSGWLKADLILRKPVQAAGIIRFFDSCLQEGKPRPRPFLPGRNDLLSVPRKP